MLDPALWLQGARRFGSKMASAGVETRGRPVGPGKMPVGQEPRRGALQRLGYVEVALLGHNQEAARDAPEELPTGVQAA
jgi:hypothetical protein